MDLTIEQPCPTCGAEITLSEDDRLIQCPFCDVMNYRVQQALPRYILPPKLPAGKDGSELFYIPYLRFKGCIYSIQGNKVLHRVLDTTRVGCDLPSLPVSLGLRPQAMKLRPVTDDVQGGFVRQSVKTKKMFQEAGRISQAFTEKKKGRVYHRAFIGETISRVYLPVYLSGEHLIDAVTQKRIGRGHAESTLLSQPLIKAHKDWEPKFISTLCPHCGDAMCGGVDSLVVACRGCDRQWIENSGSFQSIGYEALQSLQKDVRYLPFWVIEPRDENAVLESLADFFEITNQPIVIQEKHRGMAFSFILPAFKMNPSQFLQTAKMATVAQIKWQSGVRCTVRARSVYPVTLPPREAAEAMKSVLVASAVSTRKVLEIFHRLKFTAYKKKLLYLPFSDTGHDYIEHYSAMAIQAAALRFGRTL